MGHFVNEIAHFAPFENKLIFKGGTCLRKCYFNNYRFSEDLDFTVTDKDFVFYKQDLEELCKKIEANSDVKLHISMLEELQYNGKRTGFKSEIKFWGVHKSIHPKPIRFCFKSEIKFWGADHSMNQPPPEPNRWQTKVKIEIILFEKMLFETPKKSITHNYSDSYKIDKQITCYDLREVISEKLRAMIQRSYTAPRDYYDVWYMSKNCNFDWKEIKDGFFEKMKSKELVFENTEQFINEQVEKILKKHWQNSLGSHISIEELPSSEQVLKDLRYLLNEIF